MKTWAVVLLGLVGGLGGLSAGSPAEAAEYLGDMCWSVTYTVPASASGTLRLGVSHLGGGHYLVSGVVSSGDPVIQEGPLHGSAEFLGENIELTLTASDYVAPLSVFFVATFHALLNPLTLGGSFQGVVHGWVLDTVTPAYVAGTLSPMACP